MEKSLLEYVLRVHYRNVKNRAGAMVILLHSKLLALGARLLDVNGNSKAILDEELFDQDPIRLTYSLVLESKYKTSTSNYQLQISVVETDGDIFVSFTDTNTNKFGHLELSGPEHVQLNESSQLNDCVPELIYPQMQLLLDSIEQNLFKPVLSFPEEKTERPKVVNPNVTERAYIDTDPGHSSSGYFPDYGRSDLDPFGSMRRPLPVGGGMILNPRLLIGPQPSRDNSLIGGPDVLPPGAVPPGARFDPFGPGFASGRPNPHGGRFQPNLDHALPPDFNDMYM